MDAMYEYRYQTHSLLLRLDASTSGLMALVARQQIGTAQWHEAVQAQERLFEQWQAHAAKVDECVAGLSVSEVATASVDYNASS